MRASRYCLIALIALIALVPSALVLAGCSSSTTSTGPDTVSIAALIGSWKSSQTVTTSFPTATSCGNFQWEVTSQTGDAASGTFSAMCAGGISLNGTASGTLSRSQVAWKSSGTAKIPNAADCPFTLGGVATLSADDTISIPYSGSTCMGALSGTETLKKQ